MSYKEISSSDALALFAKYYPDYLATGVNIDDVGPEGDWYTMDTDGSLLIFKKADGSVHYILSSVQAPAPDFPGWGPAGYVIDQTTQAAVEAAKNLPGKILSAVDYLPWIALGGLALYIFLKAK